MRCTGAGMLRTLSRNAIHLALVALPALAACESGDGDLDPDAVTTIPPGDATGSGATGTYLLETITTSCEGDCTTSLGEIVYSACDIGTRLDSDAEVTQDGGALVIDVDDSDYVSRLEGGLDADGAFEVGGLRTQQGGEVTITARSTGTIAGTTLTGGARLLVTGMGLSCRIGVDVTGAKTAQRRGTRNILAPPRRAHRD